MCWHKVAIRWTDIIVYHHKEISVILLCKTLMLHVFSTAKCLEGMMNKSVAVAALYSLEHYSLQQ